MVIGLSPAPPTLKVKRFIVQEKYKHLILTLIIIVETGTEHTVPQLSVIIELIIACKGPCRFISSEIEHWCYII